MDLQVEKTPTPDDVFVTVTADGVDPARGVVVDAESDLAESKVLIDFPILKAPALVVGDEVEFAFHGLGLPAPVRVKGAVQFRSEDGVRARFLFCMDAESGRVVSHAVNRRAATRVEPDAEGPVGFVVRDPEEGATLAPPLQDLSVTGLSFRLSRDESRTLRSWELAIALDLGDGRSPVRVVGVVRYQAPAGDDVRVGIAFDREATPGFEQVEARLAAYITAWQARALKRASGA